ncbi:hypothetical protein D1818_13750 [Aquimarina sp. BL5]|uniref:hypothetical protein n=1 Tax=Aquimarina sp. BL5 TaxID=1714860 RepID=UPI000E527FAD|nr:hypothetical protein [Aquimarina sp. BL5]AXT51855.1 hypothetical protein D1818_13750 [Aquimarina sp. BL5]RKM99826.1 hypothetical protein D7036_19745 [Aquimarina sp. BL5]
MFYDALPINNGSLYFSKVISLLGVAVVLAFVNILIGLLFQTFNGVPLKAVVSDSINRMYFYKLRTTLKPKDTAEFSIS